MTIRFDKYQGAGNDFLLLDNRQGTYNGLSGEKIRLLCERRFGVGADGLMLLNPRPGNDFAMKYYNADGKEGSMCGNGGRCIAAFAARLGVITDHTYFQAIDGPHEAVLRPDGWVDLKMNDVTRVEWGDDFAVLDTGSPHYVQFVEGLETQRVVEKGQAVRYNERFQAEGINVDFVESGSDGLHIRTYERGVEDETWACGTGVTAAAIVAAGHENQAYRIAVKAIGGDLEVRFTKKDDQYFEDIWLSGPATFVYAGEITVD